MLLLLLLLLLPPVVCKIHTTKCPAMDPIPIPHEWPEPGDFLLGGIVSHIEYAFSHVSFDSHPSEDAINIP